MIQKKQNRLIDCEQGKLVINKTSGNDQASDLDVLPLAVISNPEIVAGDPTLLPLVCTDPKLALTIGIGKKIRPFFDSPISTPDEHVDTSKKSYWDSSHDFDSGYGSN